MANVKISALTAATTLAGTEVLPVVQGGATVKATVTQVLAGAAPASADYVTEIANASLSAESVLGTTVITTATEASKQAAAKAGRLFLPSNGFSVQRDTGSAWAPWGPIYPLGAPPTASWTWDNQGSCTVTTTNGAPVFYVPANATGNTHVYYRTAPATPYTITALFLVAPLLISGVQGFGLCFRESSSGKIAAYHFQNTSTGTLQIIVPKWTTTTSFSANYTSFGDMALMGGHIFLRIADNGTNRICSISGDGVNFLTLHTVGRTDFLTANQVGVFLREGATYDLYATMVSWAEA